MRAARKVAYSACLIGLAMIFSYVESLIPLNFGIPGVKLGLANLVVVTGLAFLPPLQILAVLISRICLTGILFGNVLSLAYSLAGGLLSFLVMVLLKRVKGFSMTGISIAGGVAHNVGQLLTAMLILGNVHLGWYFPPLLVAGVLAGGLIGMLAGRVAAAVGKVMGAETGIEDPL